MVNSFICLFALLVAQQGRSSGRCLAIEAHVIDGHTDQQGRDGTDDDEDDGDGGLVVVEVLGIRRR